MALVGARLFVALDAHAVTAASVGSGLGGARLRGFARAPLAPGALVPSPSSASLVRPDEVRAAIRRAVDEAGCGGLRATLVLPDGLARLALLSLPADADARDFVRFRLAPALPWPAADSMVDVLAVARGRVAAAALRRAAVAEHEQALAAAGVDLDRVHLAPLLALQGALRLGPREAVHVLLGDAAACLVAVHEGEPVGLRSRRRDASAGEAARLLEEAIRTAGLSGNGVQQPPVLFYGADASRLRGETGAAEVAGAPADERPGAGEAAWLRGALT